MEKLLLKIKYIGTAYCGYQVQPNVNSIQQKLNEATKALFGVDCDIIGCSRTDSGVHANCFCATVSQKGTDTLSTAIPINRLPLALCAHLPQDIAVFDAKWVPSTFHARYDVKEKEYLYRIYNHPIRNPLEEGLAAHLPQIIDENGLRRMNDAARSFVGTQDFSAYMAQGSTVSSTVRTVTRASVSRKGDCIIFQVAANGFLYHMVRILAGTLVEVGLGKRTVEDVIQTTASHNRANAGMTMPACGLYLNDVIY